MPPCRRACRAAESIEPVVYGSDAATSSDRLPNPLAVRPWRMASTCERS